MLYFFIWYISLSCSFNRSACCSRYFVYILFLVFFFMLLSVCLAVLFQFFSMAIVIFLMTKFISCSAFDTCFITFL